MESQVLRRRALIGLLVAIFGVAVLPALGYSAGSPARARCPKGQIRRAHGRRKCVCPTTHRCHATAPPATGTTTGAGAGTTTGTGTTSGTGTATLGTSETLSATLIVHLPGCRGVLPNETAADRREAEEAASTEPLRIEKLGPEGKVLSSLITAEHTIHVAPGTYEIQAVETLRRGTRLLPNRVRNSAGYG